MVIHADHGMNASTFRRASYSFDPYRFLLGRSPPPLELLKGRSMAVPMRGVIHMLEEIGSEEAVDAYIDAKLARKEKIMGIGHRVYRTLDPRAPHLQKMAAELTKQLGEPKWIRMSERIASIMREKKGAQCQRRFLFCHGLLLAGRSDGPVYSYLCHLTRRWLGQPKFSNNSTTTDSTVLSPSMSALRHPCH